MIQDKTVARNSTLITPVNTSGNSKSDLKFLIEHNKISFQNTLLQQGHLLFSGFKLKNASDFQEIISSFEPDLKNEYYGTSPRNQVAEHVFNASEFPAHYPVMQHCEMSFLLNPPKTLFFFCQKAATFGGETPICDFRKVYAQMDPVIKQEFEIKGIQMIRNYAKKNTRRTSKLKLKTWENLFGTVDKDHIAALCKQTNTDYEWRSDEKLRLINRTKAFLQHPKSGEISWFNHLQSFHIESAKIEYQYIYKRQKDRRSRKYLVLLKLLSAYQKHFKSPENRSLHAQFGTGEEIPFSYIQHIQDLIWHNMQFISWNEGDLLIIDNLSTSHGRMPFKGDRSVLVAWA